MAEKIYPDSCRNELTKAKHSDARSTIKVNPELPLPVTYTAPRHRRNICLIYLGFLLVLVLALLLLLGLASLFIYLFIHPKIPRYDVQDVYITGFHIARNNTDTRLDANITFVVHVWNPNKKIGIYYDDTQIVLLYRGIELGESFIQPFYQGHRTSTSVKSLFNATDVLLQNDLALCLEQDFVQHSIPLNLEVYLWARVKIGLFKSKKFRVQDSCSLRLSPPNEGRGPAKLLDNTCKLRIVL
ncbi:hypothetical protein O6H91_10G073400 [Diphasiastrum complanatum]|uniref:Uncharacterized protein n=1 Tax=Diphasiastrum complanatum TaxID=34168 RepID=A0ACC2CI95_DIPCM|nr:hypothetical protein O6H91_10G073400 [Diphasiastrum complanatum]